MKQPSGEPTDLKEKVLQTVLSTFPIFHLYFDQNTLIPLTDFT